MFLLTVFGSDYPIKKEHHFNSLDSAIDYASFLGFSFSFKEETSVSEEFVHYYEKGNNFIEVVNTICLEA